MQSQLLHNYWFGKAVGATSAWIWAPTDPLWLSVAVIAGISLGHLYDFWASQHYDEDKASLERMAASKFGSRSPHLEFLFAGLGRIAKTSGQVTPKHITYAEQLMQKMALSASAQSQAKNWFNQGRDGAADMQDLARQCLRPSEQGTASRLTILRCLCFQTSIKANDQTIAKLKQLGGLIGFAPPRIASEFGQYHKPNPNQRTTKTPTASTAASELAKAFQCLGIAPGTTGEKVKMAYRKQVNRHHPDKLPQNATDRDRQAAQTRMVELRNALELIQTRQS